MKSSIKYLILFCRVEKYRYLRDNIENFAIVFVENRIFDCFRLWSAKQNAYR